MISEMFDALFVLSCIANVVLFVAVLILFMQGRLKSVEINGLKDGVKKDSNAYHIINDQRDQIKYLEEKVRDLNRQMEQGRCKDLWSNDKEDDLPVPVCDDLDIEMFDNKALLMDDSIHEHSAILKARPMEKSDQYVSVTEMGREPGYVFVGRRIKHE